MEKVDNILMGNFSREMKLLKMLNEIKNMILEMKNSFNEFKIRLDTAVDSIIDSKDKPIKIIQDEKQRDKIVKKRDKIIQKLK